METVIKKHLDVEKIERVARENKYDNKAYKLFLEEIEKKLIKELHIGFTDQSEERIIRGVVEFINEVEVLRKKGFWIEWAAEYVSQSHRPEKAHAATFAYQAAEQARDNSELVNLKLYAQLTGRDENFIYYFSFCLEEPDLSEIIEVPIEELADIYSNIIKKLLAEGKSKYYAKVYAFFSVTNVFPPYRCHIAAMEAEGADKYEIDEDCLVDYADYMSGYIYDNFDVYEDSLTDKKVNRMRKNAIDRY
jgi:hypothetical protein